MNRPEKNAAAREAAAYWAVLVDAGELSPEDRLTLAEWLLAAPLHVEEFLMACTTLTAAGSVDAARTIDIEELLGRSQVSVVPLAVADRNEPPAPAEPARQAERSRKPSITAAIAASALLLLCTAVAFRWLDGLPGAGETYVTERGEQRSLTLEDGSVIHINTLSEVRVRYTPSLRELTLASGEAMFEVAPDAGRPFRVIAGSTVVQAIGTEFNVYRQERQTDVSVIEGEVALLAADDLEAGAPADIEALIAASPGTSPAAGPGRGSLRKRAVLSIGQGATILPDGTIQKVSAIDPALNTSWRSRMLVFRNAPLAQVVREFNRYNDLQMQIDDPALAGIPLTAALRADNPNALVDLLSSSGNIAIERRAGDEIVMRRAAPPEPHR